jgi:shikimate dehydrogenase
MTLRAGVAGSPAKHSLSPVIHRAWLQAAGIDGTYDIFDLARDGFADFIEEARGALRGLNVTIPFKEEALAAATEVSARARRAGAANLLIFEDGAIRADNTDGLGLLAAFAEQAPDWRADAGPVVVLGAGGAARGAVAALLDAGAPQVRLVNRTVMRAEEIANLVGGPVTPMGWYALDDALLGASALINATSLGLEGGDPLEISLAPLETSAPVMDMVYRPLETPLLAQARARGHVGIDGLSMLIGQAHPTFEAVYGRPTPMGVDVRALCLKAMGLKAENA